MASRDPHTKRHGKHHKQTKPFLNVYHPYLPLLLLALIITVFFTFAKPVKPNVLSYATNISPSGLLNQTNAERTRQQQPELKLDSKLAKAAQSKANDMVNRNYWSHITPDGKAPWIFIEQAGYDYQKAGENLAYGFSSSSKTVYAWMNSKPHRANILDPAFREVGFGIANSPNYVSQGEETVVVAMYGSPDGTVAGSSKNEGINTTNLLVGEPGSQKVSKVALFAQGTAPWAASAIGIIIGACLALLFVKHGLALRRTLKKGERFVVKHPLFDIIVAIAICAGLILISGAGLVR